MTDLSTMETTAAEWNKLAEKTRQLRQQQVTTRDAWDRMDLDALTARCLEHRDAMFAAQLDGNIAEERRQRGLMVLYRRTADLVRDMRAVPVGERPELPGREAQR